MLGLGAAAAALAPSVGQAASAPYGYVAVPEPAMPVDLWTDGPIKIEPLSIQAIKGTIRPATREEYEDAIANARADGYNRGREVESARWEARQDPSVTPSQMSRGWIYTQTGDGIVVERANA